MIAVALAAIAAGAALLAWAACVVVAAADQRIAARERRQDLAFSDLIILRRAVRHDDEIYASAFERRP